MHDIELKTRVDEFLAHRIRNIIESGFFENEEKFLKGAIKDMVRKYEVQELNVKMDKFATEMTKKHPKGLSEMVLAVRMEEDETL